MKKLTMAAALFFASLTGFTQVKHDLKLDLDFANSIVDSSAENQNLSITGSPSYTNDQWGNSNASMNFSGGSSGDLRFTNSATGTYKVSFPATLSAWVKVNAFGTSTSPIITTEDHGSVYSGLWIELSNLGSVHACFGSSAAGLAGEKRFQTNNIIATGQWYHITAVYKDASTVSVYVNGVKQTTTIVGSATSVSYVEITGTAGKIGGFVKAATNRTLDGSLDKVRIYSAALPDEEVLSNYYATADNHSKLLFNYSLNGNYFDHSIYNQATAQGGVVNYASDHSSNPNSALSCATNSYLEIQEQAGNFKCNFPSTFATWVNINAIGSTQPIFANNDRTNAYSGVLVQVTPSGNIAINVGDGTTTGPTGRRTYITTSTIPVAQWFHLTVVLSPVAGATQYQASVYFNGVLQTLGAQSGTGGAMSYNTTGNVYARIGAFYGGTASLIALNGSLDDVMFWNDSLTQSQISDIATQYASTNTFVGIKEKNTIENKVSLFPNPSTGLFTIETTGESINEITIIDVTGKVILRKENLNNSSHTLDLTSYPQGLYIVKTNCDKKLTVNKLIIN